MLALRTVEPNWLGVHDTDRVGQDVGGGTERSIGRHEAGEESVGLVGHDVLDGYARIVKSGLHDRVVLQSLLASES
jgi:hypothetical protein